MPELPEVETIKLGLKQKLIGKTITDIEVRNKKSFQGNTKDIIGKKILNIERRAKFIRFKLEQNKNLLFHLKMTGQMIYRKTENGRRKTDFAGGHASHDWHAELPNKHSHIIFTFNNNSKLYFNDVRKFGWCKVLNDDDIDNIYSREVGVEPLSKDFSAKYMKDRAQKLASRNIKKFLTDQAIIAGIGNIYSDEILFYAGVRPNRKVSKILPTEWQKIYESTLKVLKMGVKYGGTTDSDYVNAFGQKGGMQDHLKVYRRTGQKCFSCDGIVKRLVIQGRSAHYCEICQK